MLTKSLMTVRQATKKKVKKSNKLCYNISLQMDHYRLEILTLRCTFETPCKTLLANTRIIMKLIKDLGMQYPTEKSKHKSRYGIYECPICGINFKTNTTCVKSKKCTQCITCARKQKHINKKHGESTTKLYAI